MPDAPALKDASRRLCFRRPSDRLAPHFNWKDLAINVESRPAAREFSFYLPVRFGDRAQIRGTFTGYEWRPMTPPESDDSLWRYRADEVELGDQYSFRFRPADGSAWVESTDPLGARFTQNFDQQTRRTDLYAIVPRLPERAAVSTPRLDRGLTICETTLPGLAARLDLPASVGSSKSLAARLTGQGVARRLRDRNFTAVMLPIQASAADVQHYNWKFGYLITGLGAVHHQFGDWDEMRALVDEFHSEGVLVVPDLVMVHFADRSSDRAPYTIRTADGEMLWFDAGARRPVDFGTHMVRWDDPYVRRSVAELLVRFVEQLGLGAFRFDFVDGVVRQYDDRGVNYGAMLLEETAALLRERRLDAWCLSEAFATREHPSVLKFADVLYQPWVGFDCMKAALTTPDGGTTWRFDKVRDGLVGATGDRQPKPTLGYALAHDEAGRDEGVMQNHRNDRGETVSVGGHLAQLALDYLHRLPSELAPPRHERLDFVADRVALIEGAAMFGADFAYLNLGGASDFLQLGSYDDPSGWQTIWSADGHPDLARWEAETGRPADEVRAAIEAHAARMSRLRGVFAAHTPIDPQARRPLVENRVVRHGHDGAALVWLRQPPNDSGPAVLVIANFSHHALERLAFTPPCDRAPAWEVIDAPARPDARPTIGQRMAVESSGQLVLDVSPNSLVLLRATGA